MTSILNACAGRIARLVRLVAATLVLSVLCSCATSGSLYAPRPAFSIDGDINDLRSEFGSITSIKGYYSAPETPERRNAFIAGRLVLIDLEYMRFISNVRLSRAASATAFDGAALGLGFATTIVAGERAKTVLGALTTALTGARSSYEKNFYEDKTSDALVAQMNAQRKQALVAIIAGSKGSLAQYSFTQAVADLAAYTDAGTVDGALEGIQGDASQKQLEAKVALDRLRNVTYGPDDSSTRIIKWIYPSAATIKDLVGVDSNGQPVNIDASRAGALQNELSTKLNLDIPILTMLVDPGSATTRQTIIKDLSIP